MGQAGKIFPEYTQIATDEKGQIWLVLNNFESDSIIMELESSAKGEVIYEDGFLPFDDYYYEGEEDYL